MRWRRSWRDDLQTVPGIVDSHVFQVPDAPALTVDVDRTLAQQMGLDQRTTANNVLVTTNSSAQTAPNFWVDPQNSVSYPLVVQLPTYRINSAQDLWTMPVTAGGAEERAAADERRQVRPAHRADGDVAAQYPPGFRCPCRCAGPDLESGCREQSTR